MPESKSEPKQSFQADSLAIGMMVMLLMTIVQRGVGFFRGIWFCRLMDDSVVGQWSMTMTFLILITPIMLLGLPGSLPRFVEHFRIRGHLSEFVRRIAIATTICGCLLALAMAFVPEWFGWAIFLDENSQTLIYSVAAAACATIGFNFVSDLNSSLRQVRVVSVMHFSQSLGFTVLGILWLTQGGGLVGLVMMHVAATLIAIIPGAVTLVKGWCGLEVSAEPFEPSGMWRRMLPYAAALWMMNLIGNVFQMSDRYMILHLFPGNELEGQAAVGQYHSARMIPVLLLSLAMMLSGILLPYLSADLEAGRLDAVRKRVKQFLMGFSAAMTVVGAVAILLAPWMFETLLEGRYDDGLALLPMAFVFCAWSALVVIGQDYLWVLEKGKYVALALGVGLLMNVALNAWLIPIQGLRGAVVATLLSNAIVAAGIWIAMVANRFGADRTALYVFLMPATLLAGPWLALASLLIVILTSPDSKVCLAELYVTFADKFGRPQQAASQSV